jgi:hypothetical protein
MPRIDMPPEHLSDYERAVCYHTLPKITRPVTVGLIVAYAVCFLEAVAVLLYGFVVGSERMAQIGSYWVIGIVVFGVVAFMLRALVNELRERRVLAVARGVPDALEDAEGIPDPFAAHLLLRRPLHARGDLFPCTDNAGILHYFVESLPSSAWWKVKDPQDHEVIRVHVQATSTSFSIGGTAPSRLSVFAGNDEMARMRRRFSFTAPTLFIECFKPTTKSYTFRQGGVYVNKRLVGRIYYLHHSLYLDIEQAEFHEAILGLFLTMS